jgi:DNA-binding transcriptional ArsR family regulator
MRSDGWGRQDAEKLTHGLVPSLVELALIEGAMAQHIDDYCQSADRQESLDHSILAVIRIVDHWAVEDSAEQLRASRLYQQLSTYYQTVTEQPGVSPLDLFQVDGSVRSDHHCRIDQNSHLELPGGVGLSIGTLWRSVSEFSDVRALQCAYWFGRIMNRSDLSHDLRIILAVAGVRALIQDEWLLRECGFEIELFQNKPILSLMNGSADDVYQRTTEHLLQAMILAVNKRVAEVEAASPSVQPESSEKVQAQLKQIVQLIKDDPKTTTDKVAQYLGVSKRTAERRMDELKDQGLIRREGSSRNGRWVVNDVE